MKKLPIAILACVVIFLTVVVGLLVYRSRAPKAATPEPASTRADYRIKQVHLQEQARDGSRWQLDADYGEVFEEQGRTTMRNVRVRLEQPDRTWAVTGDEGHMMQATRDVEIRGRVVLISSDGLRLETEVLRWDAAKQRAWTDARVTIWRGTGAVVRGTGFESSITTEASSVKGRVRATFGRDLGHGAEARGAEPS